MTTRHVVPTTVARKTATVNGHTYTFDPNVFIDAPDADSSGLVSAGAIKVGLTDQRANRPSAATAGAGAIFIDQSAQSPLSQPSGNVEGAVVLVSDGQGWRDVITGQARGT